MDETLNDLSRGAG